LIIIVIDKYVLLAELDLLYGTFGKCQRLRSLEGFAHQTEGLFIRDKPFFA